MKEQIKEIYDKITDALNINVRLHGIANVLSCSVMDNSPELDNGSLQQCFYMFESLSEIIKEELEEARDIIMESLSEKEQNND